MPKALFFPSYRGGGFGHIGRCLALANELTARGWRAAFVLEGHHTARVEAAGYEVFGLRRQLGSILRHLVRLRRRGPSQAPTYTCFADMSYQIVRDGFLHPAMVGRRVRAELGIVRRWKPDLLIGDTWPLTSIVGRLAQLPTVQIIKSVVHPAAPGLIWWQEPPTALIPPDVRPVFNPILEDWGLAPIERAEDLLTGDLLLVPSIPELDPLPAGLLRTHYVGALTRQTAEDVELPAPFDNLPSDRPTLYVTIGGGADPVGSRRLFATLNAALYGMPVHAIVSTGERFVPAELDTPPAHVHYHRWVPGPAIIARSQGIVFHGGYGTMMEAVRYGVPAVVLPFHSEQEANGRRLESAGMGRVLAPEMDSLHVIHRQWPHGTFSMLTQYDPVFSPARLRETISAVLYLEPYTNSARQLRQRLSTYGGLAQAADLVETLLASF